MMMPQESGAGISGVSPTDDQVMAQDEQQHRSTVNSNVDDQALKCPRCDSPNTKFCYYNNYNLTQPRHFCKTCRRYWTKGGALRNVPIGGGCRKNKRSKQRPKDQNPLTPIEQEAASPSSINGLSLLHNLWATTHPTSSSNLLDLQSSDRFNFAFAKLQNHSSFLGQPNNNNNISSSNIPIMSHVMKPSIKANGVGDPSGGHMMTLFQAPGLQASPLTAAAPSSSSVDGTGTGSVSFGLQTLSNATDHWHWKLQQQRLGMGLSDQGQNMDGNLFLPNVLNNDHRYSTRNIPHQHVKESKPVVPNDLMQQVYDNRPASEWQTVPADNLLEPVPVESNYWHDMHMM